MPETAVHRIEVRPLAGQPDPRGQAACREAETLALRQRPQRIESAGVYLIEGALDTEHVQRIAHELLADPVIEEATIGAQPARGQALVEVHPLPGVMDPDAEALQRAIEAMLGVQVAARTGKRYDLFGTDAATARAIAERSLANPVIHAIHAEPFHPASFPRAEPRAASQRSVPITGLEDDDLQRLSRQAHLFLGLDEMRAIQAEYRRLDREPTEIELETLAQTWSEHCVHKTMKATIRYREEGAGAGQAGMSLPVTSVADPDDRPGHRRNLDGSVTIENLLKSTIAAATHELIAGGVDWCLSVFVDNAGVIAFDDEHAVCFKCETHNHPSAIEPYGGAATGIGGCIRDILGTGLGAKPIASTDVFCVAHPDRFVADGAGDAAELKPGEKARRMLPAGCLHPKRILRQVVAGVRDYGNRMGIPTINGAVWFDDEYVGNPLVFCGCAGVMPRNKVQGAPQTGDRIIALGGATGRDGIHGATFSSAELTDAHADEFSHAVQIGNPVTEKKLLDAILKARDHPDGCLYHAITDCGAGGFSSAVGEMGEALGAAVQLDEAPLKYVGLTPTEIWISEAQERMVLAVPPEKIETLRAICDLHEVALCDLGRFGTEGRQLILSHGPVEVGRLAMGFLHDGRPETTREAHWTPPETVRIGAPAPPDTAPAIDETLLALLAHPTIASKHWIIRQYDHEVQGGSVVKPLVGEVGQGPSDASVIRPVPASTRGLAIAGGLATGWRDDPYLMALAAIDECVRNLVCVGADPARIALLDNFCWPSCDDPRSLGELVRAAEGCADGARAYRAPFISGKDSLNNQFTGEDGHTTRIPPTLLISGIGIVPDIHHCVTMDAKEPGDLLLLVGRTHPAMGGSHYQMLHPASVTDAPLPPIDLERLPRSAALVSDLIRQGLVRAAHDCSEGGLLVAAAEMALAGALGLELDFALAEHMEETGLAGMCFAETPGRYLLEVSREALETVQERLAGTPWAIVGEFNESEALQVGRTSRISLEAIRSAWMGTLDW